MFVGALIFDRKKRIPTTQACKTAKDLNIMNQTRANTNQIWIKNRLIWVRIEANLKQVLFLVIIYLNRFYISKEF